MSLANLSILESAVVVCEPLALVAVAVDVVYGDDVAS